MIVVADSGSTSIDWRILEGDASVRRVVSVGVNSMSARRGACVSTEPG